MNIEVIKITFRPTYSIHLIIAFHIETKKKSIPQIAEENARWGADTYFYSLEPGACSQKKSLYYLEAIGDSPKPFYTNVGMV